MMRYLVVLLALLCVHAMGLEVVTTGPKDVVPVDEVNSDCTKNTCPPETSLTSPPLPDVPETPMLEKPPSPNLQRIRNICDFTNPRSDKQCTFVMFKPETVARGLVGEILSRFERKGFKLVAMDVRHADEVLIREHYQHITHLPFFPSILDKMTSSPVVLSVLQGPQAIDQVRTLVGPTDSAAGAPGQIRFDYSTTIDDNVVHASDSLASAVKETNLWF